jgi:hypothetical protein
MAMEVASGHVCQNALKMSDSEVYNRDNRDVYKLRAKRKTRSTCTRATYKIPHASPPDP